MTASVVTNPNGSVRKTLASQLDRLDHILDGLAEALNESVAAAVEKAFAGVLTEILTNPSFVERLRGPVILPLSDHAVTNSPPQLQQPQPGLPSKVVGTLRAGWAYVRQAAGAVIGRGVSLAKAAHSSFWRMLSRGRLLARGAAVVTAGVAAYVGGPRLPSLLTAVAGRLRSLGARLGSCLRRAGSGCASASQ
jgi:hypothetical protein